MAARSSSGMSISVAPTSGSGGSSRLWTRKVTLAVANRATQTNRYSRTGEV